jgi:hypothetical protein
MVSLAWLLLQNLMGQLLPKGYPQAVPIYDYEKVNLDLCLACLKFNWGAHYFDKTKFLFMNLSIFYDP